MKVIDLPPCDLQEEGLETISQIENALYDCPVMKIERLRVEMF